jgi:2-methylcitrate dehydratase PrpD
MARVGSGETRKLSQFAVALSFADLPMSVVEQTKLVILDTIGVIVAASRYPAGQLLASFVQAEDAKKEASVIGSTVKTSAVNAAFTNGTMGHDMELDDVHFASNTHAAAVIVPAALAVAEKLGSDGKSLILAVSTAYDVQCRISIALDDSLQYARAFHPTCVCGNFGAATAAAKLLNLNLEQFLWALGLAGSQACGLNAWENEPDHYVKSFQTGVPARNGVTAALLAAKGYKASDNILDGPYNVFDAFSGQYSFAGLVEELGSRWEILRTSMKKYACCRYIHAPLDAFLGIMEDEGLDVADIDTVTVKLSITGAPIVDGNELFTHNCQYALAVAAYDGVITREQFSPARRKDPAVWELANRIQLLGVTELEAVYPEIWGAIVEVNTKSGQHYSKRVDYAKGSPENPMTAAEIKDKFMGLCRGVLGDAKSQRIYHLILELESVTNIKELMALLAAE